jgi:polyisoprenyl-phosphate glycosyltransferase
MDQIYLSIVIPCYNEAEGLAELCRRVTGACANLGKPYEVVLVNDGSRDATWQKMMEATERDSRIIGVNLSRNHGHQLALSAGLTLCRGERILILDADLQDPPELMTEMMALMDQGADVVYGQRRTRAGETAFKKITASLFYRIIEKLTDVPIPRETGDFRMMSRRALDVLIAMPERHRFIRGMVSWIGFRQVPLMYDRAARFAGETKYPLRKMIRFAIDAVTSFSVKPLALASFVGVISGFAAVIMLVYSIIARFVLKTEPGWSSLMAVVTLLGSVQLLVLGIFGEYLGRLYEQSKGRPLFIIQQVVQSSQAQQEVGEPTIIGPVHAPAAQFAAAGQKVEI